MAKKTRKQKKTRRHTRRRIRRGGKLPLPSNAAIEVSTAGDNSDNLVGY